MSIKHSRSAIPSAFKRLAATGLLTAGLVSSSQAVTVTVAGSTNGLNDSIVNFINSNFSNVTSIDTVSGIAPGDVTADILIIGRRIETGSAYYSSLSAEYNALSIPVVAMTSYVTRTDGTRWSWHDGGATGAGPVTGEETTITLEGAALFGGAAGTSDWWSGDTNFDAAGVGAVGDGTVLATIGGGNNLVVGWDAGDLPGAGIGGNPAVAFGGPRLLFNLPETAGSGTAALIPDTAAGTHAFRTSIAAYTTLIAVPEPSGAAMLLGSLGMLAFRRRRA